MTWSTNLPRGSSAAWSRPPASRPVLISSHVIADLERVCDYLVILVAGGVQLAGDIDTLLSHHALIVGPRREEAAADPSTIEVVQTERQTLRLVRTAEPEAPHTWADGTSIRPPTLEELVLAYLRMPQTTRRRPDEVADLPPTPRRIRGDDGRLPARARRRRLDRDSDHKRLALAGHAQVVGHLGSSLISRFIIAQWPPSSPGAFAVRCCRILLRAFAGARRARRASASPQHQSQEILHALDDYAIEFTLAGSNPGPAGDLRSLTGSRQIIVDSEPPHHR
jgi:hypothetical protein